MTDDSFLITDKNIVCSFYLNFCGSQGGDTVYVSQSLQDFKTNLVANVSTNAFPSNDALNEAYELSDSN